MKTIENKLVTFKKQPLLDETASELTVKKVVVAVLQNSVYQNSSEIIRASRILSKIDAETSAETFSVEDADYEFIKQWASVYQPIVNKGLMFLDFFNQLT